MLKNLLSVCFEDQNQNNPEFSSENLKIQKVSSKFILPLKKLTSNKMLYYVLPQNYEKQSIKSVRGNEISTPNSLNSFAPQSEI
jgi:hypothetical protein